MTDWEKLLNEPAPIHQRVAIPILPLMIKVSNPEISYKNGACHACGKPVYPEVLYNIQIGMSGRIFAVCNNPHCYTRAHEKVLCELLASSIPGLIVDREGLTRQQLEDEAMF